MQVLPIAVKSFEKTLAKLSTVVSYEAASDEDEQGQQMVVALSFCPFAWTWMSKTSFRKNSDAIQKPCIVILDNASTHTGVRLF